MLRQCLISVFFAFCCLNTSAQAGDAPVLEARISIAFSQVNLDTALCQLNRRANIRFSYHSKIIPRGDKITGSYRQETLRQILDDLLSGTNLFYKAVKGKIVINKRNPSGRKLRGMVVDGETGVPLVFAHVFINKSLLGTATGADGTFEIEVPRRAFDLVVSYVGYQSKMIAMKMDSVQGRDLFRVEMVASPTTLGTFEVRAPPSRRIVRRNRRLIKKFEKEFLGRSAHSKKCKIMNPEVLEVQLIDGASHFKVTAEEELIIENRALGYRIKYLLGEFIFDNGAQTTSGMASFHELEPGSKEQCQIWEEARRQAYYGSLPHFLNALIQHDVKGQGFEVNVVQFDSIISEYTTLLNPPELEDILKLEKDGSDDRYRMIAGSDIEVTYTKGVEDRDYVRQFRTRSKSGNYKYTDLKSRSGIEAGNQIIRVIIDSDEVLYQKSVILFKNRRPQIKFPGVFSNDEDALFLGYWNWGGIAEKLPVYYQPCY